MHTSPLLGFSEVSVPLLLYSPSSARAGVAHPLSCLRAGSACCESVSLRSEEKEGGGAGPERGRGEVTAAVGNGILGCCKVALPYPDCWGGVLGCSGTSWLCLPWNWCFRMLGSSIAASCRAGIFGSPCSILPFPVPGIVLGSETWL